MGKAKLVKKYRQLNKLTQKQLGEKLGVSSKYISNIENFRKKVPQRLIDFFISNFNISSEDLKILNSTEIKGNKKADLFEAINKKLNKRKLELDKREKEILARQFQINTSDSSIMLRANIREELIKINSILQKELSTLESYMVLADEKTVKYFNGSLNLTIEKFENAILLIEKMKNLPTDIIDIQITK